ncbi:threonine-phosphate decarboxylase CobD [Paenibacillus caui]|uniref:threonine-phosphate decarboxylase CobD n=1 Tax=Paenibacillus caui TaxID=2873927 RepID=UPI001CAA3EB9|nr:threonine-phosphate decarboxylase CobD [Paenibacillus caui]
MLEKYGHGGDIETAAKRYGLPPKSFLDFSANINPLGPPPGLLALLKEELGSIIRYPDPGHRAMKELLGSRLHVRTGQLIIGNGAAEVMALALLALAPRLVGIVEPCFSEYAELSRKFGAAVMSVRGNPENNYKAAEEDIASLMQKVDVLFLGQPNNPNGVQYPAGELVRLAEAAERCQTHLIVDEAFIDFIPKQQRQSLLSDLERYRHVLLIRSMTKFYAIPGLRLGYGIGHPELIQSLANKQVTWSVNGLALLAGEFCLGRHEAYEEETIRLIAGQRDLLRQGLASLGCFVCLGEANFLLVRLPEHQTVAAVQDALGRRGVLVRSCAMYPGLTERDIRVAVKDAAANGRLLHDMKAVLEEEC